MATARSTASDSGFALFRRPSLVPRSSGRFAFVRPWTFTALLVGLAALSPGSGAAEGLAGKQEAATAVYVRVDNDETTVITPRLRVASELGSSTRAEVAYSVDVWSSASIDIRTAASRSIARQHENVIEQRDQIDVTLSHELSDLRVSGAYRYSNEPDYVSHGGSLGTETDLGGKSATLGVSVFATFDAIGRVGSPAFDEALTTTGGRLTFSQVLDPDSLLAASFELGHARGYLSSPYRYVGIGSPDATCRGVVDYCLPENNPRRRVRHALALRYRRALGHALSAGAGYRYYLDDWELDSHTGSADLSWLFQRDGDGVLSLRYRLYTQSAAAHYRPSYPELTEEQLYTRDKELSPLHSHRLTLDLEHSLAIGELDERLTLVVSLGPTHYRYRDYALLDTITALEATLSLGVEL